MRTRGKINSMIKSKLERIKKLTNDIKELERESMLLSDRNQRFEEKIEHHPRMKYQRKDNPLNNRLIGRIHWDDALVDEDTGNVFNIKRSRIVRIDDKWVV